MLSDACCINVDSREEAPGTRAGQMASKRCEMQETWNFGYKPSIFSSLFWMYPSMTPKERENAITKEHKAVFLIGIGGELSDGSVHDGRASDYDDWSTPNSDGYKGLNGDILLWNNVLESSFEVSSMGIRVDPESLRRQLAIRGDEDRAGLYFHKKLLSGELPQTIGGGIGQSRLCMFLLRKAHIGEIQSGLWPEEMVTACRAAGIDLV